MMEKEDVCILIGWTLFVWNQPCLSIFAYVCFRWYRRSSVRFHAGDSVSGAGQLCGSLAAVPPLSLSSRIEEKKRRMKVSRPVDMHKIPWSPCCYRQFVVDIWSHSDRLWYFFYRICSDKGQRYNVLPLVLELAIVISRVAVTFLLKSPVALWFRLQLIGLWFQKLPVRSMSVNVTQHYKSIPHLWKWFHVKMTNCKRFAGLWLKHHWETPHNLLRSRSNQPTPCSASMVAGRSRGFEDLPVDVTLAEGCLLFESWCLHTRRYLTKQKNCEVSLRCVAVLPISDAPQFRRAPWNCIFTEQISTRIVYIMYEYINWYNTHKTA